MLEAKFPYCCGIDVHKKSVTVYVIIPKAKGKGIKTHLKSFRTTTGSLRELAAWLGSLGVQQVAMESTGVYWKPVYNILHSQFEVWVVNARHLKQVPGRKTDVKDAQWIAQLMRLGLLERSFIPDVEQRDLRDLTRYRTRLTQEKSRAANRVEKILEDANIKLSSFVSDIQGVSARAMLAAMIGGEEDVEKLAEMARGRMRPKIPQLMEALTGMVRDHHRFILDELLTHIDHLNERISKLNKQIREVTAKHEAIIERLDAIPGIDRHIAEVILAEVGSNVDTFPTAKKLAAWACLCPGNNISANKRRSGKTAKGQVWLKSALVEAAHAASRAKATYLSAQFHRLKPRRGVKRAAVAVAHSIITIVYHLLADPQAEFKELGGDYFLKRNEGAVKRRAVNQLQGLGFRVELQPIAAV